MDEISRRYIVDQNNCKVAVQIDIDTFERIEEVLENYALVQLMNAPDEAPPVALNEAKAFYDAQKKAE